MSHSTNPLRRTHLLNRRSIDHRWPFRALSSIVLFLLAVPSAAAVDGVDLVMIGPVIYAPEENHPKGSIVTSALPGDKLFFFCAMKAVPITGSSAGVPDAVLVRFQVNGQTIDDKWAPVPLDHALSLGTFWTAPAAGSYEIACSANDPPTGYAEADLSNNRGVKVLLVEARTPVLPPQSDEPAGSRAVFPGTSPFPVPPPKERPEGPRAGPPVRTVIASQITSPVWQGQRIDLCLRREAIPPTGSDLERNVGGPRVDAQCGSAAADRACQLYGFTHATGWSAEVDVGPTWMLGDQKACTSALCDGFEQIVCSK